MKMDGQTRPGPALRTVLTVLTLLAFVCAGVLPGVAGANGFPGGEPIIATDMTNPGPQLPAPPPAYNSTSHSPTHTQFANFAWRQFFALSAPAGSLPANRGRVNQTKSFADSASTNFYIRDTNLLVWQTYAHRAEFLPYLKQVSGSPVPPISTRPAFASNPQYFYRNYSVPSAKVRYNNLDEASQIALNLIYFPINKSKLNWEVDNQLLFEAKVNQVEYDHFEVPYDTAPVTAFLPDGSVEVKAGWVACGQDCSRYHTAEATYYTGTDDAPVAETATFGLVALHIIRKMDNYPALVYTTFEHVDNYGSGAYFLTTYVNLGYDATTGNNPIAVINNGTTVTSHRLPSGAYKTTRNINSSNYDIPSGYSPPAHMGGPVFVVPHPTLPLSGAKTTPATMTKSVQDVNSQVLTVMESIPQINSGVWKYYRLTGVQAIPTNEQQAGQSANPATLDYFLANNVVESAQPVLQLFNGGNNQQPINASTSQPTYVTNNRSKNNIIGVSGVTPVNMGGCMGCHGEAQYGGASNFTFLIVAGKLEGKGFPHPDAIGVPEAEAMFLRTQKYMRLFRITVADPTPD